MIHLKSFMESNSLMWLKRLHLSKSLGWKLIVHHFLHRVGGCFVLNCHFDEDSIPLKLPLFYQDILRLWVKLCIPHTCHINTEHDILNSILWNNKHIKIGGKSVFDRAIRDKGFIKIHDIIDRRGNLIDSGIFQQKGLNNAELFKIRSIYTALPSDWKTLLKLAVKLPLVDTIGNGIIIVMNGYTYDLETIKSKIFYEAIVLSYKAVPTAWNKIKGAYSYSDKELNRIFKMPFLITIDNQLRAFQIKILHDIVPLNGWLFKVGLSDSPFCCFCNSKIEGVHHFFVDCQVSRHFWRDIKTYFCNLPFPTISHSSILHGLFETDNNFKLIGQIILVGKQTLYNCKIQNIKPTIPHLFAKLRHILKVEEHI